MSEFKNFDIKKAKELSISYEIRYAFLTNLITAQEHSTNKSIVGTTIEMKKRFSEEIVKQLLDDLGYKLTSYTIGFECSRMSCQEITAISFVPKDFETTEG